MISTAGGRILLIEDDTSLQQIVHDLLESAGHRVEVTANGKSGLDMASQDIFQLIVLDVMLPGMSGFDICRQLRKRNIETPILMLTARSELSNKVVGFKAGADDYLTKPFEAPELLVRAEALLRRARRVGTGKLKSYHFGDVDVDFKKLKLSRNGETVSLSEREATLLRYFIEHRGEVLSREKLLRDVWDYKAMTLTRTVDMHVASLRQKIGDDPKEANFIVTVHGEGYRFDG